ncbi:MAG: hypothetical protein LBN24_13425 [Mediterranea sp.]|jgi:hypothetical protein|nr:hypothetical protein [Mediterranea sp.]
MKSKDNQPRRGLLKAVVLVSLLLCSGVDLYAQHNYRPGYIITLARDTVYGEIDLRTSRMNAQRCAFKAEGGAREQVYAPFEIEGYRFTDDGKYYVSRYIEMKRGQRQAVFLEYLLQGIKSLYYYEAPGFVNVYFIEKGDKLVKVDAPHLDSSVSIALNGKDRYIPTLHYVFDDYQPLGSQIDKTKFNRQSLIKLAKNYHNAVCTTGEECVEFETKEKADPPLQWTLTPYVGIMQYISHNKDGYGKRMKSPNLLLVGATFTLSNKRWTSAVAACMDLSYSRWAEAGESAGFFAAKLGIRGTYPKGVVRPFAELGADLDIAAGEAYPGYYVRGGVNIHLGAGSKHAFQLSAQFKGLRDTVNERPAYHAWGVSLGYVF